MQKTLIERRTLYREAGVPETSYAACLLCDNEAEKVMLCRVCWKRESKAGNLWKYPGEYLDDYTGEGEDTLNAIVSWFFEWDMHEFIGMLDELGFKFSFVDKGYGRDRVSFAGYKWATGEHGCVECGKDFGVLREGGVKHEARGLCKSCYNYLWNDPLKRGRLSQYPTRRYVNNVRGHMHFMLTYHPDRVRAMGEFYGVRVETPVTA